MLHRLFELAKDRDICVDLADLQKVMEVLGKHFVTARVGNCGWAKAPTCYFVIYHVNDGVDNQIANELFEAGVKILDPNVVGY